MGTSIAGVFPASWVGALGLTLGWAGLLVLREGGLHRSRGSWIHHEPGGALAITVTCSTLYAIIETVQAHRRKRDAWRSAAADRANRT